MNTIEKYQIESENERGGWRGMIGAALAFTGLLVFANATLVALLFRQALSLRTELILIAIGGVIGIAGLMIRGYKSDLIVPAICSVLGGIVTTVCVNFVEGQFGFLGIMIFAAILLWATNKLWSRMDDNS